MVLIQKQIEQGVRGSVIPLMYKSGGIINSVVKWLFDKLCLDILLSQEKKKEIERTSNWENMERKTTLGSL